MASARKALRDGAVRWSVRQRRVLEVREERDMVEEMP